jgi:hypothetical protein
LLKKYRLLCEKLNPKSLAPLSAAAKSKSGAARSKINPQKHFAPRQVTPQIRRALSNEKPAILYINFSSFVYED